ncbi:MAG: hypothetical protein R2752_06200 [Vicinamibacterales bacterium]
MTGPRGLAWLPVAMVLVAASPMARARPAQEPDPVPRLLDAAARYLDDYDRRFSAVVSEEHYSQYVRRLTSSFRELRSDVLVLNAGHGEWLGFRDVFEVDRQPVRDRTERLAALFASPSADMLVEARAIAEESARFNVGAVTRNVNVPTFALAYLRREAQPRSRFTYGGSETVDDTPAQILQFEEVDRPRLVKTTDGAPARGRFWLEAATGRVLRTAFEVNSMTVRATFDVTYAAQPKLDGLWVPVRMREHYQVSATQTIDGTAEYANFRRYSVDVATIVK